MRSYPYFTVLWIRGAGVHRHTLPLPVRPTRQTRFRKDFRHEPAGSRIARWGAASFGFKDAGFDSLCSWIQFPYLQHLTPNFCESSAVQPPKITIQPPFSTIPCNLLYLLANPVLPFLMFSSLSTPFANRSCRLTALNPGSPLSFNVPTCKPSSLQTPHFVSPFPAALTDKSQLTENPATLSSFAATLTSRVKHKSIVCHSYRKHPGRWAAILTSFAAPTEFIPVKPGVCALLRQLTAEKSRAKDPQELKNLAVRPTTSHESAVTASALFLPPVTSHQSPLLSGHRIFSHA